MKKPFARRLLFVLVLLAVAVSQGILASCAIDRINRSAITVEEPARERLGELPFRVLHKADYNIDDRPTVKNYLVLTAAEAYATELKKYSIEFPVEVDFDSDSIVVATMGTQNSGGYAIGASRIDEYADKVIMQFELVSPADNCQTTSAQSNPYEFVIVPTTKPIEFNEVARLRDCE